jgi:hypothetical protein
MRYAPMVAASCWGLGLSGRSQLSDGREAKINISTRERGMNHAIVLTQALNIGEGKSMDKSAGTRAQSANISRGLSIGIKLLRS